MVAKLQDSYWVAKHDDPMEGWDPSFLKLCDHLKEIVNCWKFIPSPTPLPSHTHTHTHIHDTISLSFDRILLELISLLLERERECVCVLFDSFLALMLHINYTNQYTNKYAL